MNNNKKKEILKNINDFDAVSLYPSAMIRLNGFLQGIPKIITNTNYNDLINKDGYFVEILIKKVGIKRNFSLMSYKDENGIRYFNNEMENKTMFVDNITLEDLIEYHHIEFDIVRGYYFDEGYNTKIKEVINFLFNERLKKKNEKNPIEIVYKLIMNSSYGKTIMKPVEEKSIFFDNEYKSDIYIQRNYNWIKSYLKFNNKIKIDTINTIDEHFNMSHIGCQILSMSKRIMNELMCLAEDNNIILYYQDTDSIHIEDDDIKNLEKIYNDKYGRELIGKSMGQFHSDFVMKGAKNIISTKLITLGKKSYCDVLQGYKLETKKYGIDEINNISLFNKNGDNYSIGDDLIDKYGDIQYKNNIELDENNNKIIIQDYHFRMKGIP